MARDSKRLFLRLNPPQRCNWGATRKNWGEWVTGGLRTMLRKPKVEGWRDEWSREEIHPSK